MAFIICEGLDRSGKSSLADYYRKQGYEVVHMSAPNKKYLQPGYVGPSYLDECIEMYMKFNGKNVFFDRSIYGELLWPQIYVREPMLSEDDIEILREIEDSNDAVRIYMYDTDKEAHWARCVANKEPLNRAQFSLAYRLYDKLATEYGFERKTLHDFKIPADKPTPKVEVKPVAISENAIPVVTSSKTAAPVIQTLSSTEKLEQANAINDLLGGRIIKKKSDVYDNLENDIRGFLSNKLNKLLGNPVDDLTEEELFVLKNMAKRLLEKGDKK